MPPLPHAEPGSLHELVLKSLDDDQAQEIVSIPLEGKSGDIAQLCEGVNGLLDTMTDILVDIKTAASEVSNASPERRAPSVCQRTEDSPEAG